MFLGFTEVCIYETVSSTFLNQTYARSFKEKGQASFSRLRMLLQIQAQILCLYSVPKGKGNTDLRPELWGNNLEIWNYGFIFHHLNLSLLSKINLQNTRDWFFKRNYFGGWIGGTSDKALHVLV